MRLPSFLKLNGQDKEDATKYRMNLYGAIRMPDEDRVYRYMDFMNFVYEKEFDKPLQKKNIDYYGSLMHLDGKFDEDRSKKILNFYTR